MFQELATTIKLSNSDLPALITYDGSLALPMCSEFPDASVALNTINNIEGAIFLGGLKLSPTSHRTIECGSLSEVGQKVHSNRLFTGCGGKCFFSSFPINWTIRKHSALEP